MTFHMRFEESDRITLRDTAYKISAHTDTGVLLEHIDHPGLRTGFTFAELSDLLSTQDLRIERRYFDEANRINALRNAYDFLSHYPAKVVSAALWQATICDVFYQLYFRGEVQKTTASVKAALAVIKAKTREALESEQFMDRSRRGGANVQDKLLPAPSTLLKWVKAYAEGGYRPIALIPQYHRSGNRSTRFCIHATSLMARCVDKYLTYKGPTKEQVVADTIFAFKDENALRLKRGQELLRVPSARTILRRIAELDPYYVCATREGIAYANNKFNLYERGVRTTRPLERVEMDEWKVDVISLLAPSGLLDHLDPAQIARIKSGRRWLYVAMDHATRCILSMRLAESPNGEDAVRTLEEITRDKTDDARAMGCATGWHYYGGIFTVVTDQGSAFISERFREALDGLGATTERPPAGAPTLRSTIERLFRTLGLKLMPLLAGRTYGNPKERGDYDSKYWASLSDDELIQVLILFVVDVYHNQPHKGLFGETPANCWDRLSREYGVTPPPDGHVRRAVFGTRQTRKLKGNGVRMFGIDYTCQALREHFIHGHDHDIELRVDERDLGWISVKVGKKWYPASAVQSGFDGVSVAEWQEAARALRSKYRKQAVFSEAVVRKSLAQISGINRAAMKRRALTPYRHTAEQLQRSEDALYLGLSIACPQNAAQTPPPDADLFGGELDVQPKPMHASPTPAPLETANHPEPTTPIHRPAKTTWTLEET